MKRFSIVVPVFNVEKELPKCLDSLIKQTFEDFECYLVCDKSTDKSESIVSEYLKKDKRFHKLYKEKTGLSIARNIGIEKCQGEYLLFVDGDDFLELNCLEMLDKQLEKDLEVLRFQAREIKKDKSIDYKEKEFKTTKSSTAFENIVNYHYVENAWCYCYKLSYWKENNFKFMENCLAEDFGLTPLVLLKAKNIKSISYIGYNYVQRENSLMTNTSYNKKIKKMDDMLKQVEFLTKHDVINENKCVMSFLGNSLIYYSTKLEHKDYKKYNKILKERNIYDYLLNDNLKRKIKKILIKSNSYLFYNFIVRFL